MVHGKRAAAAKLFLAILFTGVLPGRADLKTFKITDRKPVIQKVAGKYLSFPQLVKAGEDKIMMFYREAASTPGVLAHGKGGDIKYVLSENNKWGEPKLLYKQEDLEYMSCDATALKDGNIIIHCREYGGAYNMRNYTAKYISKTGEFTKKKFIGDFKEFCGGAIALFGKVIERDDGSLLLGVYGIDKEYENSWAKSSLTKAPAYSAACLISKDKGETWEFYSWIARADKRKNLYEPVMVKLKGNSLYCLLRTLGDFYCAVSEDSGKTWGKARRAFAGVAATGLKLSTGEIMMLYRGNEQKQDGFYKGSLFVYRISGDNGETWEKAVELDGNQAIQGGSYGMGDAVELKDGSVKVVYYTSDKDESPWIEGCTLVPAESIK